MKNRLPMERRCCSNAAIPGRRKGKPGIYLTVRVVCTVNSIKATGSRHIPVPGSKRP